MPARKFICRAGWRGYDPSQGLAVADRHVVLAAAGVPQSAAPVSGVFRATGAQSTLAVSLDFRATKGTAHGLMQQVQQQ